MSLEGALGALNIVGMVFSNIVAFVNGIAALLMGLGMTQGMTMALLAIGALLGFIFVLEFMQQISKGLIIILVLWIVGSILGII